MGTHTHVVIFSEVFFDTIVHLQYGKHGVYTLVMELHNTDLFDIITLHFRRPNDF